MESLKKVLLKELQGVEGGYILILGGYERAGYVIVKGSVLQGETLILTGSVAFEKNQYQRMTQQRPVTCPQCGVLSNIPKDQEKLLCPSCKKESPIQVTEDDKKFMKFKNWTIGFTFWAEEQTLRQKIGDFLTNIPHQISDKPEAIVGGSGVLGILLRIFGK